MERRAFLKLLCMGVGVAAAAAPAEALTSLAPLAAPDHHLDLAPQPGVATSEDMERAKVEKAYYGHWRRVHRRHHRVYRRHWVGPRRCVVFIAAITGVIGNDRGGGRASGPPPRLATHSHGSVFFSFALLLVSSLAMARVDTWP